MGDADVIQVIESLGSLTQGEVWVDMEGKAQGHDMGVMLGEFQGRYLEFLILRRMEIIKSPLFERDISADKTDQPAVLLVKRLNA